MIYQVREKQEEVIVLPADNTNEELKKDIDTRLNLNEQNLKNQRFWVWRSIWRLINKKGKSEANMVLLNELLQAYQFNTSKPERDFKAFCGFIVYWYEKRFKNELSKVR